MYKTIILISLIAYVKAQFYQSPCQTAFVVPSPCPQSFAKPCGLPGPIPVAKIPYEVTLPVVPAPTYVPNMPCREVAVPACQNNIYIPEPIIANPLSFLESAVAPCSAELSLPLGLANPFLPAASPVSAISPMLSPFLPPAGSCGCRCQYLKKIPIPPPCI